ncbi:hypothetical protein GF380_06120 [Candidatus Uhrbacteria bacterium]|nr:hypothetical protein [Candidatus Uhrbacteria bacterium]
MSEEETGLKQPYAYISGALTVMTEAERQELRDLYILIGKTAAWIGFGYYCPHVYSDPELAKTLSPQEVDQIDRTAVTHSAVVIAEVSIPSHGCGIEVEMAYHAHVPVILLVKKGTRLSRLVAGSPSVVAIIEYESNKDLLDALQGALRELIANVKELKIPEVLKAQLVPSVGG